VVGVIFGAFLNIRHKRIPRLVNKRNYNNRG
jgi:hypothetical protein